MSQRGWTRGGGACGAGADPRTRAGHRANYVGDSVIAGIVDPRLPPYRIDMSFHSDWRRRHTLARWQTQQKSDGVTLLMVAGLAAIAVANFLLFPETLSAVVMGLFLAGLGLTGVRLVRTAARVVELKRAIGDAPGIGGQDSPRLESPSDPAVPAAGTAPDSVSPEQWFVGPEFLN